jgi:hypothetical protein
MSPTTPTNSAASMIIGRPRAIASVPIATATANMPRLSVVRRPIRSVR